ncbi:DNA-binding CsgD family transcriptional regulator [Sporomusaceae bacterium BoRhaA]|uniref:response regulator transcription factor n=1 Tax=Pelorhabdus rhamnosifermentans TaxID=2772457 RepID=UPI001C0610ED|nr:helix-turn-helix transcriptional regulator [Pelorhabdus rhamnosifermentans]MBU2703330.1 DNA-binding CsgD family transcriptional regulator [Pelorhabdus rhamnosifermentans]
MHISETELVRFNKIALTIHECTDIDLFETTLLRSLQELVLYDNGGYFHPDPATRSVTCGKLLDTDPKIFQNYKKTYEKHDFHLNHLFSTSNILPTERRSDSNYFSAWKKSPSFAELYLANNLYHMAVINVVTQGRFTGRICMYRKLSRNDFSNSEMTLFYLLSGHIQSVYTKLQMAELYSGAWDVLEHANQGICFFDQNLHCIYVNQRANLLFKQNFCYNLYSRLQEICREFAFFHHDAYYMPTQTGTIDYKYTKINYSCFSYSHNEEHYLQIVFDYYDKKAHQNIKKGYKDLFTEREKMIVKLIAQGKTNKEISELLIISLNTVKTHIKNMLLKTGTPSRAALAVKALSPLLSTNYSNKYKKFSPVEDLYTIQ